MASPQIRNMGTLAGNICQDVWCWYLQDGFSCWKSGGKFCDLAGGDSRYYGSIMGGHLCLSNHPSDTAVHQPWTLKFMWLHRVGNRQPRSLTFSPATPGSMAGCNPMLFEPTRS